MRRSCTGVRAKEGSVRAVTTSDSCTTEETGLTETDPLPESCSKGLAETAIGRLANNLRNSIGSRFHGCRIFTDRNTRLNRRVRFSAPLRPAWLRRTNPQPPIAGEIPPAPDTSPARIAVETSRLRRCPLSALAERDRFAPGAFERASRRASRVGLALPCGWSAAVHAYYACSEPPWKDSEIGCASCATARTSPSGSWQRS